MVFFAFNNFPATDKIDTFPVSAGDVIEEALREKPTCELVDVKGKRVLSIPCTRENAQLVPRAYSKEISILHTLEQVSSRTSPCDVIFELLCFYIEHNDNIQGVLKKVNLSNSNQP
jgi:hypothetical protein